MKKRSIMVGLISFFVFMNVSLAMALQPFPDTGQTKCYGMGWDTGVISCPQPGKPLYGQDAQYPRLPRSYTKLGMNGAELSDSALHVDDGGQWIMTRDNVTGLIWEVKTNVSRVDIYTRRDAINVFITDINALNFGGFSDWRMPSRQELVSLVDIGRSDPAINLKWFPKTVSGGYWTATGWRVAFSIGDTKRHPGSFTRYYVRAVRAGTVPVSNFVDNNDGTVTDTSTGLMWQRETATYEMTWSEALAYAENLSLAGHTDWRLPNRNEIQTIVDDSEFGPAVFPPFRPDTWLKYWTSSTNIKFPNGVWLLNSQTGEVQSFLDHKHNYNRVRVVRTAQEVSLPDDDEAKAERIFNAAEAEYPEWFYPKGLPIQIYRGYEHPMYYRYYQPRNIFLLTYDGVVYYYYNGRYTAWGTVDEWLRR